MDEIRRIMSGLFGRWAIHRLSVVVMGACLFFALFGVVAAQDSETAVPTPSPEATPGPTAEPVLDGTSTSAISEVSWQDFLEVVISITLIILIAIYGGKLLYRLLQRLARRSNNNLDNQLLEVIRPQIAWFLLALGFQFSTSRLDFLDEGIQQVLQTSYFLLYLFVILATVWRVGDFMVDWYITKNQEKMNGNLVEQIVPMMKRLIHILLLFIAAVIAASYFGIDILAVSAALGLGGFALALAAKDSITNIISGFVIMVSQPFRVGDRIDVASLGSWGEVAEIGIRSTIVLMRDNRQVIVPNSAIVDNTVVNYTRPDTSYRLQSDVGVACDVDITQTQQIIKDTVRNLEGILPEKPVDVWFTEFGDSSLTFRVRWWVPTYADKRRSTDSVNAAIQAIANQENIDLPNPIYTLENKIMLSDEDVQRIAKTIKEIT